MVQSDKLKKIIAEVKEESSPVITLSNELIADFSKELDSAISELDMIMESIGENSITDADVTLFNTEVVIMQELGGEQ